MEQRSKYRDQWWTLIGLAGSTCLVVGVLMLVSWEIPLFRATTFERDFAGARCGTPLDNPGWRVGSACHGAVNRQTAVAWVILIAGLACIVVAVSGAHQRPRRDARRGVVAE
jgi:hypothetical protein